MSRPFRSERHAALDAVYPTTCNQNCNQGRMCDCVENVPNVQKSPINSGELAICGFVVVCFALPFIVGPWLWPYVWGVFA